MRHANAPWYYLHSTPISIVETRLAEMLPIYRKFQHGDFGTRVGQCLEIAIYKALYDQSYLDFFGSFSDLDNHNDSTLYSKEEPPQSISGRHLTGNRRLDFLIHHPEAGWAGVEAKNIREWIYPDRSELRNFLVSVLN